MDSYYCIVATADEPVADLCVLDARDDGTALDRARAVAEAAAGWEQVSVYAGERVVGVVERMRPPTEWPLAA
ncbi:MAG: hypothetical protein U1E18_20540 [Brevundimonas sp.]|uniref:hypothetical protein n=1 Tax=Brevundimonas sp. TaxID=1871086 RepID=UPI002ABA7C20|nr:hypothetical protein [Brevundimonas sp.]MDZ4111966.1 hypothetical protein [Brevundimonas sp.]